MEKKCNEQGHLTIGGVDALELATTYGTPLMVYDVADIRARARAFHDAFQKHKVRYQVAYASKALAIRAMYSLCLQEHLHVDVVSGGELFTARSAGVPAEKIHFHGNNKSEDEILYALREKVGCFVVDSVREVELLPRLARLVHPELQNNEKIKVLLRVAPGITAHTHEYNTTGQVDSKFGLDIESGQATQAYEFLSLQQDILHVVGLHCHIGSQIFSTAGHVAAATKLLTLMDTWGMEDCVLNVGGGYGVTYTDDDHPLPFSQFIDDIVGAAKNFIDEQNKNQNNKRNKMKMPTFWIEPGRSLVSQAGTTLYRVGSMKVVPEVRTYVAVDGGMSDNMRPVTYQAVYTAAIANRIRERNQLLSHDPSCFSSSSSSSENNNNNNNNNNNSNNDNILTCNIVGKLCESGDQLIRDAKILSPREGEVLAVFCTGAYCYSMASNYNRMCRPAIVFVEEGEATLVVARESYEDLIRNEREYSRNKK